MAWKKSMQMIQTAGEPPRMGRIILAIIGWTQNRSPALTNMVTANKTGKKKRFMYLVSGE
jgi:hypothetical protein